MRLSLLLVLAVACTSVNDELTPVEAREALSASVSSARGEAATTEVISVTTSFTLGEAAEDAAEELRAWWASQAPCAEVSRDGATTTVDFGDLSNDCTYEGHTYSGLASVTVERTDEQDVLVSWVFDALSNGDVSVSGDADVTWVSGEDPSRHVVHDLTWDRGGETIEATGDRTQTLLDTSAGLSGGIEIEGARAWSSSTSGDWSLDINDIEALPTDPVPQHGVYVLTTPAGKEAVITFERIDDDTIRVTVSGVRGGDRIYDVSKAGDVSEADE